MSIRFLGRLDFYLAQGGGGSWSFQWERFIDDTVAYGGWSHDGLHFLGDGDHLRVFRDGLGREIAWEGTVATQRHGSFQTAVGGLWIHSESDGLDRASWARMFHHHSVAELMPANVPVHWLQVLAADGVSAPVRVRSHAQRNASDARGL
ncbi:MAG: hypothetical protein ACOYN3_01160 [Acidimicrobiia bacterium]